jgi:erythromycin esterase-like protein
MKTLPEVETAKELMTEAAKWSVMKWLREKKRVRRAADQANAALDGLNAEIKQGWPETLRTAYDALATESAGAKANGQIRSKQSSAKPTNISAIAQKIKGADEEAYRARILAEKTFDEAEKRLSTSLARQGCVQAIQSWELHEKAIREAESCGA